MPELVPAIRSATIHDGERIEQLLSSLQLPTEGIEPHLANFVIAEQDGQLVGVIGFERYGEEALLRSAAVAPAAQRLGIGKALTEHVIGEAAATGIDTLFLLTTTAERFFSLYGFETVSRAQVPGAVQRSIEFTSSCPASATVMRLSLRGH
jgi:amino-acid N-acetyltransferase